VTAKTLIEFSIILKRAEELRNFLESKFGEVQVIEKYLTFYRWKVTHSVKLSQLFGEMSRNVKFFFLIFLER
jgi:hypothetical protein